jgi:hypothetical protein
MAPRTSRRRQGVLDVARDWSCLPGPAAPSGARRVPAADATDAPLCAVLRDSRRVSALAYFGSQGGL